MWRSVIFIAIAVAAGALLWWTAAKRDAVEQTTIPAKTRAATVQKIEQPTAQPTATPPAMNIPESSTPLEADATDQPVAQTNDKVFKLDANGNLVLDAHTRLNLEALIARTPDSDLGAAKQEIAAMLPAAAAAQAAELIDRYYEYDIAQRQTYPPGRAPSTEEEALAELEGLHALREAHFGAEIARAFYAEDEAVSRELLELMKLEKDQSLTLAEKAERAQRMRDAQQ